MPGSFRLENNQDQKFEGLGTGFLFAEHDDAKPIATTMPLGTSTKIMMAFDVATDVKLPTPVWDLEWVGGKQHLDRVIEHNHTVI